MKEHWLLDPAITFLNHGSYGATPRPVLVQILFPAQTTLEEAKQFIFHELQEVSVERGGRSACLQERGIQAGGCPSLSAQPGPCSIRPSFTRRPSGRPRSAGVA